MPTPNKGEKKSEYMSRCIKQVEGEGKTHDQAVGKCEGMWADKKKVEGSGSILLDTFQNTPCAIVPEKLEEINAFLLDRLASAQLSDLEAYREGRSGNRASEHYRLEDGIAHIPIYGVMSKRMNMMTEFSGGTSTQVLRGHIQAAIEDPQVKGIFLDVDSPGGAVEGTKELADFIKAAREIKPIVAFTDGLMASAAYWVSSAASEIFGTDLSQAGSIGVAAVHNDFSEHQKQMGVKKTNIYAGKYKRIANQDEPLTAEGKSYIQEMVDAYYKIFVDDVASNRGVSSEDTMKMAEGKVFIGTQAKNVGLIDHVGEREAAINRLQELVQLKKKGKGQAIAEAELNTEQTEGGNITMDLKELKEKHPELVKQLQEEAQASVNVQIQDLSNRLNAVEQESKTLKTENIKLKEQDILRSERELSASIESIWSKKLNSSKIPSRRHEDLKKVVNSDEFVKEGVLDVTGFSTAIDAKIKDWESSFTQPSVLGFGTSSKEVDSIEGGSDDQDRDLTAEEDAIVKRNLKIAK
jgi:signal peptide peptidase SppA